MSSPLGVYSPFVVSCINARIDDVFDVLSHFFSLPERRERFVVSSGEMAIDAVVKGEMPAGSGHRKSVGLFVPGCCSQSSCALIANLPDGWNSLAHIVSEKLQIFVLVARVSPLDGEFPSNSLTFVESGVRVRHVSVQKEGFGWVFYERGARLSIEDEARYAIRTKRDRVTPDYVVEMATKCGFPIGSPGFWKSGRDAWYFHQEI